MIIFKFAFQMKVYQSIFFSLFFLVQSIAPKMDLCCELNKLPNLYEHYLEHKECNDDSFVQFVWQDYLNEDTADESGHHEAEHEDLPTPGQGDHNCCHTPIYFAYLPGISLEEIDFSFKTNAGFYNISLISQYADSFFQPPQV